MASSINPSIDGGFKTFHFLDASMTVVTGGALEATSTGIMRELLSLFFMSYR